MTRCGIARMGRSEQNVMPPRRKALPRCAEPSSSRTCWRMTLNESASVCPASAAFSAMAASGCATSRHDSAKSWSLSKSASNVVRSAALQSAAGRGSFSAAACVKSACVKDANRPSDSARLPSTAGSGRMSPKSCAPSPGSAKPRMRRSIPNCHVCSLLAGRFSSARCSASRPQRIPLPTIHWRMSDKSDSLNSNFVWTAGQSSSASTAFAVKRESASSSTRRKASATPLSVRTSRSAME